MLNPEIKRFIRQALKEDGVQRDITTNVLIPSHLQAHAVILSKEKGVIAGLDVLGEVFKALDKGIIFKPKTKEGSLIKRNEVVAHIQGSARVILTAERTALNFLSHLSGVATLTRRFVDRVKPYKVKIFDTRKTTPGLRYLEKYAVRQGGGFNHRLSLGHYVLIKDNHLKFFKLSGRLPKIFKHHKVEIEVENLKEFEHALKLNPEVIMLDNMAPKQLRKAVRLKGNLPIKLEASGGITLKNVKKIAATGVDMISVGSITHSAPALDFSLEIIHG